MTTIHTPDQRDALPLGVVVLSEVGSIACRADQEHGVVFGDERPFLWTALALPLTVLHDPTTPQAEACQTCDGARFIPLPNPDGLRLIQVCPECEAESTSAPPAEGDVREALTDTVRAAGPRPADVFEPWDASVTPDRITAAVLSSGLVVPVGEVERRVHEAVTWYAERERPAIRIEGDEQAEAIIIPVIAEAAKMKAERDAALAAVETAKADALRDVDAAITEYIERLPDFEGGDYPEGEYDGAWQALLILRDLDPASTTTSIPARLLSGVHSGRTLRVERSGLLVTDLELVIHGTPAVVGRTVYIEGADVGEYLAPDEVVTLVTEGTDR